MIEVPFALIAGSFRDPSGFLFSRDGVLYRQVNHQYQEQYDLLLASGLYQRLVDAGMLVPHREVDILPAEAATAYKILQPERIDYISYPYEWLFSQLQDAALLTLALQKAALECDMSLKDASAYNVQFHHGKPVFIDTLSFERYTDGAPWAAYRQFCQHFLAPLALMSRCDIRLNSLLRIHLDGVPLDLASALLRKRTGLNLGLLSHIHLHARAQKAYEDKPVNTSRAHMSRFGLLALIDSLESTVKRLGWQPRGTEWGDYYDNSNYTDAAAQHKRGLVADFLRQAQPRGVWDLGANTGLYSRVAAEMKLPTIAFDIDPAAVERHYRDCRTCGERYILPLLLDLTNPSPAIGWAHTERMSFMQRGPVDAALALALIHHLAIANNLPLGRIAAFFADICSTLIIEFVPKEDSQVQRLLATREDIFPDYAQGPFEQTFAAYFTIQTSVPINDSARTLYLMQRKDRQT